jgi:uncharacterized membrane protein YkvA (DUF1232 family)
MTDKQHRKHRKSNILKNKYYWLRLLLHIPNFFKLMLSLLRDKQVPFYLKVISYTAFLYCLSPYDLIPIFAIPLLGWLDDVIIFYICMKLLVNFSPPGVVEKHVKAIDEEMRRKFNMWR